MKRMSSIATAAALAVTMAAIPAFAQGTGTGGGTSKQPSAAADEPGRVQSGPGVQGAPDTRTGPSTRSPGDSQTQGPSSGASSGASSGEGSASPTAPPGQTNATQPSQDSSGVQGPPDTRTGPSTRSPGDQK